MYLILIRFFKHSYILQYVDASSLRNSSNYAKVTSQYTFTELLLASLSVVFVKFVISLNICF